MLFNFITAVVLTSSSLAFVVPRNESPRCAASEPTEQQRMHTKMLKSTSAKVMQSPISVDTYFHVVSSSTSTFVSEEQLQDQFDAMNAAYGPHDISFALKNTTFTVNATWAAGDDEVVMKTQLRQGDYSTLNVYLVDTAKLGELVALGYCYLPEPNVTTDSPVFVKDGCVVKAQTVPGGSATRYNGGGSVIHEVGHWFDLFHTFQGGCDNTNGDMVSDTPAQLDWTSGCPVGKNTCSDLPGEDPIHNFMDYSDE